MFFVFAGIISCKNNSTPESQDKNSSEVITSIKYAKGFDLQYFNGYNKLIIKDPYPGATEEFIYYLVPKNTSVPAELSDKNIIFTPLTRLVATSTTHIPMIELFNQEQTLVGFPQTNYISSERTVEKILQGKVAELGSVQDLNMEILIDLQPELVIAFTMDKNDPVFKNMSALKINVLFNGDWLEETPLGRAEWLKLFGALFDQTKKADSLFLAIENNYTGAKKLASEAKESPTVLTGSLFQDKWHLPAGGSFMSTFFKDANTRYLWKDSPGTGSLVLGLESVLEVAGTADLWIGSGIFTSYHEMESSNAHYSSFNAFQKRKVYTFSKKKGNNGGILFLELAPIMPDIVLKDIIKIAHPALLPEYDTFFLEPLDVPAMEIK